MRGSKAKRVRKMMVVLRAKAYALDDMGQSARKRLVLALINGRQLDADDELRAHRRREAARRELGKAGLAGPALRSGPGFRRLVRRAAWWMRNAGVSEDVADRRAAGEMAALGTPRKRSIWPMRLGALVR